MRGIKKTGFLILAGLCSVFASAQTGFNLEGRILNSADSSAIEMVAVVIKEMNIWSVSDQKGNYVLRNIPAGTYIMQVSSLGYEPREISVGINAGRKGFNIYLNQQTLAIDEVVVVARDTRKMESGSTIEQTALQHVQPTDLSDVLQLLPGQITSNPDLSAPKGLSIREINVGTDRMASLGTLLIIDGAPISNDANLQFTSSDGLASFSTTATGGADVRQVSVDNIESVEVVRGIAGVENGDMLSGAVKVNLKKGKTPFTTKVKIDPEIKQVYFGKGFMLPNGRGTLNTDLDYTQSLDDIRDKYKTFNRFNGGLGYNNVFFKEKKPLNLNVTLRASQTIDVNADDPDMLDYEKYEARDKSIAMTVSGKWFLNSPLISTLNLNVSGNLQHQVGHEIDLKSLNGAMPQPTSLTEGEHETGYLPSMYISEMTVDGKPYYFNSKLSASKNLRFGNVSNEFSVGTDWKQYGNNGLGRIYDLAFPPNPTSSSDARPRSYKDIPGMKELAFYGEEKLSLPLGMTKLDIQAGIRFSNVQPDGLFKSRVNTTMLDPRFNLRYTLIDNRSAKNLKSLVARFGWGSFSKAPTLLHYYPDKCYYDRVSFNYYEPPNSLLVLTTRIFDDTRNYDLKPATNRKFDTGLDFKFRSIDVSLTGFYEKMANGFSFERKYSPYIYNVYGAVASGMNPYFIEGEGIFYPDPVSGNPVAVPFVPDTVLVSYSFPKNNEQTVKKGVEFSIDFGTVKALRTSFVLDGAYMNIRKQSVNDYLEQTSLTYQSKPFPLVGLYPGGNGNISERLNSNLRTITHIKELRMVFTLTTQIIWFEKYQYIYNDRNGNPLIYTLNPVEDVYTDLSEIKYVDPVGYYDLKMVYHDYDPEIATVRPYSDLVMSDNSSLYIQKRYPPAVQFNLRLTKEISDRIDFSFYCNNLTNYQPLTRIKGLMESYIRRNDRIYFGAEIRIKI